MAKKQKSQVQPQPTTGESNTPESAPVATWSPKIKIALSLIAVVHLFAVFSAPWAIPQPSSQMARGINGALSPWTHMLYMRHGYRFFAPDPGPSHLILYEVTKENGETVAGKFPDKNVHRPRLMYHRFFMISEHFWGLGVSQSLSNQELVDQLARAEDYLRKNGLTDQADWMLQNMPQANQTPPTDEEIEFIVEDLKRQGRHQAARAAKRELQEQRLSMETADRHRTVWLEGIANYLKRKHGGTTARIWIQEHTISDYVHILDGGKLTDPQNYRPKILVYTDDEVIE